MKSKVLGIHHVTAISGAPSENYRFYTQTLGQRLVKKTVNYDDPGVYHLYYGDRTGSPGTLMTFFPYGGPPARKGTGQVASSAYPVSDLQAWRKRLEQEGVRVEETEQFGQSYLAFQDPHGMNLEIFEAPGGPDHPVRIQGATLPVQNPEREQELLEFLGFEAESESGRRQRFRASASGDYLDLVESQEPRATGGAGSVHHIALRVANDAEQNEWLTALIGRGYRVSPVMDRNYFHSIYFRSPNGILFELATDPPGMLIDESEEELGTKLVLPPQYERVRAQIEAALEPLEAKAASTP
ncbi:MAG: ring-cleaving dioxygenase [Vulcanimicrobiota bacterium]